MTDLLEQAIERVRAMPAEMQDEFARVLLRLAGDDLAGDKAVYQLTPDEDADLAAADAEIERGEFATDEQVRAVFTKYSQ